MSHQKIMKKEANYYIKALFTHNEIQPDVFTARKRSLRRLCFYRCLSVHRGGGGRAWLLQGGGVCGCSQGVCMVAPGGMHGCSGGCVIAPVGGQACVVAPGGHAWLLPAGGGGVVAPRGAMGGCSQGGGACVGYDEIRRYDQ